MRRIASLALVSTVLVVSILALAPRAPAQETPPAAAAAPPIDGIAEKMGRRVLSELRQLHHAMPRVFASTHVTQPDGGEEVFVAYEYSDYDACVAAAPDRRTGREQCRDRLGQYGNCTKRSLARVTIAATPRARPPGTGGALVLASRMDLPGSCQLERVLAFERRDVDLDERPEIVVDLVTRDIEREFRSGQPATRYSRQVWVLREDLGVELERALGSWGQTSFEMGVESSAARWSARDASGDGHPDVIVESFEYEEAGGCTQGPDGWFTPSDPDEESECAGELRSATLRWDAATDSFVD